MCWACYQDENIVETEDGFYIYYFDCEGFWEEGPFDLRYEAQELYSYRIGITNRVSRVLRLIIDHYQLSDLNCTKGKGN